MSDTLATVVDSSFDLLTREEARCLKRQGVGLYIQCLWTGAQAPATRLPSLENALLEGLNVGGYSSLNGSPAVTGAWHMKRALDGVPQDFQDELVVLPVDVELAGITTTQIWDAIKYLDSRGFSWKNESGPDPRTGIARVGIYTSYHVWHTLVTPRNPQSFSSLGVWLWNANWDGKNDRDFDRLPFGGWQPEQVAIEQWSGGAVVCGQFVDRNTAFVERLLAVANEDEEGNNEMDPRLDQKIRRIGGGAKQFLVRDAGSPTGLVSRELTRLEWLDLSALGLVVEKPESHQHSEYAGAEHEHADGGEVPLHIHEFSGVTGWDDLELAKKV